MVDSNKEDIIRLKTENRKHPVTGKSNIGKLLPPTCSCPLLFGIVIYNI